MQSLQTASLEEIRKVAARICRDYLTGRWKVVPEEDLIVKRISGGLSNFLYYISLPHHDTKICSATDDLNCCNMPREVLLRIYGQTHGGDAMENVITESVVFALLSERNFGPKLYGIFPGGRLEQYIKARPLLTNELSNNEISIKIAEKMGEIHTLNIPMSKEPDWIWNCISSWLKCIENILDKKKVDQSDVDFVNRFDFKEESLWLKRVIDTCNYAVTFCHNDLQEGNILIREKESFNSNCSIETEQNIFKTTDYSNLNLSPITNKCNNQIRGLELSQNDTCSNKWLIRQNNDPDLIIIDFEYCAYNYRGFDLANHFLEWTFDYSNPEYPFFFQKKNSYPTKEQRKSFLIAYLKKVHEGENIYIVEENEVQKLEKEVQVFSMLSHFFWSLWSIVNVTSNIQFGYWNYSSTRINAFLKLKEEFKAMEIFEK